MTVTAVNTPYEELQDVFLNAKENSNQVQYFYSFFLEEL